MTQKVSSTSIEGLDASKVTGAMPALDGSALTNLNSGILKSTTNPAIDSNPSGGVGTLWVNKTTGQIYNCTDATAGSNVWTNIGSGTGAIEPFSPQGSTYGFASGGGEPLSSKVEKFSLISSGNSTPHGDLTGTHSYGGAHSSGTHGYASGGHWSPQDGALYYENRVEKFAFSNNTLSDDHADLSSISAEYASHSSPTGHGYISYGGTGESNGNLPYTDNVKRFSFTSSATGEDVGSLGTEARKGVSGCGNTTHGFACAGYANPNGDNGDHTNFTANVRKFDYSSSITSSDHGNLLAVRGYMGIAGCSSTTDGFVHTGYSWASGVGGIVNNIEKISFSNGSLVYDHGNLSVTRRGTGASSSTTHGHVTAGAANVYTNIIDKYQYSTASSSVDVGDLSRVADQPGGHQV